MSSSKFSRNIKGRISTMANWSGGRPEEETELPGAFGEKLRQEMEIATAKVPIKDIELDLLLDNPYQHLAQRVMDDDSMQELVDSIKNNGFYGALLARRKTGEPGKMEVAYGHRRKEAAQRAGLTTVPVKVLGLSDIEMARIMASENFSRLDLNPIGEAAVVGFLAEQQNLSAREISQLVGKKRGWVESRLSLYNAPAAIKQMVEQKPDSFSHVPLLLRLKQDLNQLKQYAHQVVAEQLTVEELKERIDSNTKTATPENDPPPQTPILFPGEEIVKNETISMLHGNSDTIHNVNGEPRRNSGGPAISKTRKELNSQKGRKGLDQITVNLQSEDPVAEGDLEEQLGQLEQLVNKLSAARSPEILSWGVRSRIQRISQLLKDLVGGD